MPDIQVTDEVYERITGYAHRWGQTEGQVVDTLVRLFVEPVHTVALPPAPIPARQRRDAGHRPVRADRPRRLASHPRRHHPS